MLKELNLQNIRIDGGTQQRPLDEQAVAEYTELVKGGQEFEPVNVVVEGKDHYLYDGFHRLEAYRKAGKKTIPANIEEGTLRDAIFFSFQANKKHGVRRQKGVARSIVEKMLKDDEWGKWTYKDIADWVGLSERSVRRIASDLKGDTKSTETGQCPVMGQDESEITEPEMDSEPENEGNGDTEAETDAPDKPDTADKTDGKPVYDSLGEVVPEHLRPIFERVNVFRQMIAELNAHQKICTDGVATNDPLFLYINMNNLKAEISNVKRIVKMSMPYAVCRYCGGTESQSCKACDPSSDGTHGGIGWISELRYQTVASELKK